MRGKPHVAPQNYPNAQTKKKVWKFSLPRFSRHDQAGASMCRNCIRSEKCSGGRNRSASDDRRSTPPKRTICIPHPTAKKKKSTHCLAGRHTHGRTHSNPVRQATPSVAITRNLKGQPCAEYRDYWSVPIPPSNPGRIPACFSKPPHELRADPDSTVARRHEGRHGRHRPARGALFSAARKY